MLVIIYSLLMIYQFIAYFTVYTTLNNCTD
nr:MAG TPA: hypothetical protein [Myoviridae sp. ctNPX13]